MFPKRCSIAHAECIRCLRGRRGKGVIQTPWWSVVWIACPDTPTGYVCLFAALMSIYAYLPTSAYQFAERYLPWAISAYQFAKRYLPWDISAYHGIVPWRCCFGFCSLLRSIAESATTATVAKLQRFSHICKYFFLLLLNLALSLPLFPVQLQKHLPIFLSCRVPGIFGTVSGPHRTITGQ